MRLKDLPEINFATADPQKMAVEVVATVESLLGRKLERADPFARRRINHNSATTIN